MSDAGQTVTVVPGTETNPANYGGFQGAESPRALQNQQQQQSFTAEQIEAARAEERSKLYGRIETSDTRVEEMGRQLKEITDERDVAAKAEQDRVAAEQEAARVKAEEDRQAELTGLKGKEYTDARFSELQNEVVTWKEQADRNAAILDQERKFSALQEYRANRLADDDAGQIIPQLRDLVTGSTKEEIEASVQSMLQRSAGILGEVQQAQQAQWQQMPGVSTFVPASTVADTQAVAAAPQEISAAQIQAMGPAEFARQRQQLLAAASAQYRQR